jgi:hypothetical protein
MNHQNSVISHEVLEKRKEHHPENTNIMQESKVGKQLSDLTVRRVIILVLAMLISGPIFSDTTY